MPVSAPLPALPAGTTIYVRAVAENVQDTTMGPVSTFTTASGGGLPPVVETSPPLPIDPTSFKVHGSVNPRGLPTVAWFEWGTDPGLAVVSRTDNQPVGKGKRSIWVYQYLTGLSGGLTYYVRIVASNAAGKVRGEVLSITLP